MNYIKTFKNSQGSSVSVGNSYSEDHLMHTFLDKFHQGGKYTSQIAIHQAELIIEEKYTNQKYLSISCLQTDYLNIEKNSGSVRNNKRENFVQEKITFCGGTNHPTDKCFKNIKKS